MKKQGEKPIIYVILCKSEKPSKLSQENGEEN